MAVSLAAQFTDWMPLFQLPVAVVHVPEPAVMVASAAEVMSQVRVAALATGAEPSRAAATISEARERK